MPLISIYYSRSSIINIKVFGNFTSNQVYRCFFSDYSFHFVENNSINKFVGQEVKSISYNVPDQLDEYHCFRLDFGFNRIDSLYLDCIQVTYSDNKVYTYSAKQCLKRINYCHLIDHINYFEDESALLYFDYSPGYAPYIEFDVDNRTFIKNNSIIFFGLICLILLLIVFLRIKKNESFLLVASILGYYSFFSTILINNLFIIAFALISIYYLYKKKKIINPIFMLVIGFVLLFCIKLIWALSPNTFLSFWKTGEKYLTLLVVPLSYLFIPINRQSILTIMKGFFISCVLLLYVNFISLLSYNFYLGNASYPNSMFFHFVDFIHSSYIAYFYTIGLIAGLFLIREHLLNKFVFFIITITYAVFCILTKARIGLFFFVFIFLGIQIISDISSYKRNKLYMLFGLLIFLFAFLIPFFPKAINKIDTSRTILWNVAKESIENNLEFGLGTGSNFEIYNIDNMKPYVGNGLEKGLSNAHNQLLNEMIQHGFIIGSMLYFFLLLLMNSSIKNNNRFLYLFIVVTISFMTTEVITERSRGIAFFVFMTCLLYNMFTEKKNENIKILE